MNPNRNCCRVAFIGAGAMAREHARAFAAAPRAAFAGIFSRTSAKAEQLANEFASSQVCGSVSELYERTSADLVVISVSPQYTREIGLQCLEFPWCVLMEKPPGLDLDEAYVLKNAANRLQRKVLVALNRRFYFSTRTALHDLEQRKGPRHVHIFDQQSIEFAAMLGHEKAVLDSWHYCNSIHMIDYLRIFGRGNPTVTHISGTTSKTRNVLVAAVEFGSGDTAIYECIWNGPGPWAVMVTTPEKRWEMRPLENVFYQDAGSRALVPIATDPIDTNFKAGFRLQAEHAIATALGECSQSVTLDEAVETMRLVAEIYEGGKLSLRKGSPSFAASK